METGNEKRAGRRQKAFAREGNARRREAQRSRAEELRAEQPQAEHRARVQRQSAEDAEQPVLQWASKNSRDHGVFGKVTPSHRPDEEMIRQQVRARTEASCAPCRQQDVSMAHKAGPEAEARQRTTGVMTKPACFGGTGPSTWISHMEYYLGSAGVQGEAAGLRVAVSFLGHVHGWAYHCAGGPPAPTDVGRAGSPLRAQVSEVSEGKR